MWYSCFTNIAIWDYIKIEVLFADISKPNTSISKIIDLMRPDEELADMAFSDRQNAINEHCEKLKKLVHKLNFQN